MVHDYLYKISFIEEKKMLKVQVLIKGVKNMEITKKKKGLSIPLISIAILVFVFVFPRILISKLGPGNPWTSYLYQYGFGSITFIIGIILILRTKACKFNRGSDKIWFKWLIAGFIFFATVHAVWILLALYMPYKGGL